MGPRQRLLEWGGQPSESRLARQRCDELHTEWQTVTRTPIRSLPGSSPCHSRYQSLPHLQHG